MATAVKTILATGVSSGLGFEAIKTLLTSPAQPYNILLGARNTAAAEKAYEAVPYDKAAGNAVTVLPVELNNLNTVRTFAGEALKKLEGTKVDYVLLNAGIGAAADQPGVLGSQWCEPLLVNHVSQHYLMHLLREKIVSDKPRIVFVSSGAIRNVPDTSVLPKDMKANAGTAGHATYSGSKFIQLLGAHWWRRTLAPSGIRVLAVSPGLVPGTGLGKNFGIASGHPDAKTNVEGGDNVLRAMMIEEFPEDEERNFLTSWGEWWEKDVYENSLDKALQDEWAFSVEELEKEAAVQKSNS